MADLGGVEFLMELNAKLDQATKMVRELNRTEAAVRKADLAIKKAERQVSVFSLAMGFAGRTIGTFAKNMLGHFTALASFEGLKNLGARIVSIGSDMVMAAAGAAKTRRAFDFLFGADLSKRMEDAADALAKQFDTTDDIVKSAMQELGAAGLKPTQIIDGLAVALEAAAKTGKDSSFHGVVDALKTMQQLNRVPRSVADFGLDKTAFTQMQKEVKRGTKAIDAFYKVVDRTSTTPIATAALSRGQDLDVTIRKLQNLPEQFGQKLAGTAGYEKFRMAAAGILEKFDPDGPVGKRIFSGLEQMFTKFASLIDRIDIDKVTAALLRTFEVLPGMVESATKAIGALVNMLGELFNAWQALKMDAAPGAAKQGTGGRIGGAIHSAIAPIENELQRLLGVREKSMKGVLHAIFTAGHLTDRLGLTGAQGPAGLAKGIDKATPAATTSAANMATATVGAAEGALGVRSPSKVFEEIGQQTAAGFALGVGGSVSDLQRVTAAAFSPLSLAPPMQAPGAQLSGGTSNRFEANITVNIHGAETGRQGAEQAAATIRQELEALFSDWAAQGGGS